MTFDYKSFVDFANTDDRVGPQTFQVTANSEKEVHWEGGTFQVREVSGVLTTASGAKIRMDFGSLPDDAEAVRLEEGIKSKSLSPGDRKKVAAIGKGMEQRAAIKAAVGKEVEALEYGDEFRVEVIKTKDGFVRVKKVLGPVNSSNSVTSSNSSSDAAIPF